MLLLFITTILSITTNLQAYCPLEWVQSNNGFIPDNAVLSVGNHYVARIKINKYQVIGNLVKGSGFYSFSYRSDFRNSYEVLTNPNKCELKCIKTYKIPVNAVSVVVNNEHDWTEYVGRDIKRKIAGRIIVDWNSNYLLYADSNGNYSTKTFQCLISLTNDLTIILPSNNESDECNSALYITVIAMLTVVNIILWAIRIRNLMLSSRDNQVICQQLRTIQLN